MFDDKVGVMHFSYGNQTPIVRLRHFTGECTVVYVHYNV